MRIPAIFTLAFCLLLPLNLYAIGGGISLGNTGLFAVKTNSSACLYKFDKYKAVALTSAPCNKQTPSLSVRYKGKNETWFMLVGNETYAKGNNPVFYYNGQLFSILDSLNLYDFDVCYKCRLAAFSYWQNDFRHITVRRIK
jgi:hypothetical protein